MGQISLNIPQVGLPDTTEDVKVANNFTTIQNAINGGIDSTNISATLAQAASINQSGQTVKGATITSGFQSTTSSTYTTLSTPDQVSGITLSANGLLFIYYRALWSCSVGNVASATLFLGSNQIVIDGGGATPSPENATMVAASTAQGLTSYPGGLVTTNSGVSAGNDVTTGQMLAGNNPSVGGACVVFAAAGTYTISVQFKTSAGTVGASNRRLYVQAVNFV